MLPGDVGRTGGRAATPGKPLNRHHNPKMGTAFVHTVIDDHRRAAYAEIHDDETAATATAVLCRAVAWYAERGATTRRVLSDNGAPYRSHLWKSQRRKALPAFPHEYNHHRPHTALGGQPPITRLTNLPGQHTQHSRGRVTASRPGRRSTPGRRRGRWGRAWSRRVGLNRPGRWRGS
ncbi:hypothetical protein GCM10023175_66180 [Pseudonocardia xishanensis]|uniref:Integrase-like protein n=1 Tax=Pseudonocardia xishanensis TaxID=630995 RepID=A0ABP8S4A2_9PSEU